MDTSDARPVVGLITAKTCGHCHTFRSNVWSTLKPRLESDGRFRVVEIDLENTNSVPDKRYPSDLARFVQWFPMLFMATGPSWNEGLRGGSKIDAVVFSGQVSEDRVRYQHGPQANRDNVMAWIEREIKNPIFVAKPKVVFTANDPSGPKRVDVVPTIGSVCSRNYRPRNAYSY